MLPDPGTNGGGYRLGHVLGQEVQAVTDMNCLQAGYGLDQVGGPLRSARVCVFETEPD